MEASRSGRYENGADLGLETDELHRLRSEAKKRRANTKFFDSADWAMTLETYSFKKEPSALRCKVMAAVYSGNAIESSILMPISV